MPPRSHVHSLERGLLAHCCALSGSADKTLLGWWQLPEPEEKAVKP